MRRFKVKDLTIDIAIADREAFDKACMLNTCRLLPSKIDLCWQYNTCRVLRTIITCRYIRTTCPRLSGWYEQEMDPCAGTHIPEIDPGVLYEIDPRELAELRLQLVKELEQVEALEQQLAEQMTPQTVQEVEMLEAKFQDALGELNALKGRMKAG